MQQLGEENRCKKDAYLERYRQWKLEKEKSRTVKPLTEKGNIIKTQGVVRPRDTRSQTLKKNPLRDEKNIQAFKKPGDTATGKGGKGLDTANKTLRNVTTKVSEKNGSVTKAVKEDVSEKENQDQAVHIEDSKIKPQDQLTMKQRLIWDEKKHEKGLDENSSGKMSKKRPIQSAPSSPQKRVRMSAIDVNRRSTFSVRSSCVVSQPTTQTESTRIKSKVGSVPLNLKKKDASVHRAKSVTNLNRRSAAAPANGTTGPRVAVKKPVVLVSPPKQRAHPYKRPGVDAHKKAVKKARLSAGLSKRPVGILKRKSGATELSESAPSEARSADRLEAAHVKFQSPCLNSSQQKMFRKTPAKGPQLSHDDSMRNKLNCWLEAKGKTPSKFRHLMCFDAAMSERKKQDSQLKRSITVNQLSQQQKKIAKEDRKQEVCQNLLPAFESLHSEPSDISGSDNEKSVFLQLEELLKECHRLIDSSCPSETLMGWLNNIFDYIPLARHYTPYYVCKVDAVKRHGSLTDVLDVLSEAITNSAQPSSELASLNALVMQEMFKNHDLKPEVIDIKDKQPAEVTSPPMIDTLSTLHESRSPGTSREPSPPHRNEVNGADAPKGVDAPFSVQYSITNVTPFKKRKRSAAKGSPEATQTVVTPVRRSVRRSVLGNVTDAEKLVNTISELSEEEKNSVLFRPNHALDHILHKYE